MFAACGAPSKKVDARVDLRVCVEEARQVEAYAKYFTTAVVAEPRGGRECDFTARGTTLNAGKVTLRSAYDDSILGELDVPVELAPKLAAFTLARGTEVYSHILKQRDASGFTR